MVTKRMPARVGVLELLADLVGLRIDVDAQPGRAQLSCQSYRIRGAHLHSRW